MPKELGIIRWRVFKSVVGAWLMLVFNASFLIVVSVNIITGIGFPHAYAWFIWCFILLYCIALGIDEQFKLSGYPQDIPAEIMAEFKHVKEKSRIRFSIPLYLKPDSILQAGVEGLGIQSFTAMTISPALCAAMPRQSQWQGIFAHELAHIKTQQILGTSVLLSIMKFLSIFCVILLIITVWKIYSNVFLCIPFILAFYYIEPIIFGILNHYIYFPVVRQFEYAADALGAYILGSADCVIDVLNFLYEKNNWDGAQNSPIFIPVETTHPALDKRIAALERLRYRRP